MLVATSQETLLPYLEPLGPSHTPPGAVNDIDVNGRGHGHAHHPPPPGGGHEYMNGDTGMEVRHSRSLTSLERVRAHALATSVDAER